MGRRGVRAGAEILAAQAVSGEGAGATGAGAGAEVLHAAAGKAGMVTLREHLAKMVTKVSLPSHCTVQCYVSLPT